MIDCGLPIKRMESALLALDIHPSELSAIFLTHEHYDHTASLRIKHPFPQKYGIPVYASSGLWRHLEHKTGILETSLKRVVMPNCNMRVGDFTVRSVPKPHDAVDPIAFTLRARRQSISVVTDLGTVTEPVFAAMRESDYIILESNHDRELELFSGRPRSLINRVLSRHGHLSNQQAAEALQKVTSHRLQGIALGHLSLDCNRPELALDTVRSALAGTDYRGFLVALPHHEVSDWLPVQQY